MSFRTVLLIFLILLVPLAGVIGFFSATVIAMAAHRRQIAQQNRELAEVIIDRIVMRLHWQGLETNEQFKQEVVKKMTGSEESYRVIRPPGIGPDVPAHQPQDDFERELLKRFAPRLTPATNQDTLFAERFVGGKYEFYQPVYLVESCVTCHRIHCGNTLLAQGDLLSIMHVQLPQR